MRDELGLKGGMRTAGVERVIAHVLLWGGLLGGLLVVLGLILFAGHGGFQRPVLEVQRLIRPGRADHPPEVFVSVSEVLRGPEGPAGRPARRDCPRAGVAADHARGERGRGDSRLSGEGDRRYAAIAGVVLSLLLTSLLLAGGAG